MHKGLKAGFAFGLLPHLPFGTFSLAIHEDTIGHYLPWFRGKKLAGADYEEVACKP
jgi:hypothetical protein